MRPASALATTVAAYVAVALLTACSDARDAYTTLFPLEVGDRWVYEGRGADGTAPDEDLGPASLTIGIDREVSLDGTPVVVRRTDNGAEYYLRHDASGIYRVASRIDIDEQPTADRTPRYVLKGPLQVGASWEAPTVPYLIRRSNEFPRDLKKSHRTTMRYRVTAIDTKIDTPAGSFTGCLSVRGEAEVTLFTDPVNGFHPVPLVSTEIYCPGIGLVQFSREETVPSGFMRGGTLTYTLVETNLR